LGVDLYEDYRILKIAGFREAKRRVLQALREGRFQHEVRGRIDEKNLLLTGMVTAEFVASVIVRCRGQDHSMSAHHADAAVTVHVLRRDGWYIKFYFVDPDTFFISVHK
jgi:hypothetical protein